MRLFLIVALVLAGIGVGATPRSAAERHKFLVASGYPKGRPGFIVDHKRPLCLGGADLASNMQWQPVADSLAKDKDERAICAAWRTFDKKWNHQPAARTPR